MHKSRWAPQPSPAPEAEAATTETSISIATSENDEEARPVTSQSLSAAAPTFEPTNTPPVLDDGFAQTFQEDDLFDDVIPLEETMQTRAPEDLFSEEFTPAAAPVVERIQPISQESRGMSRRARGVREVGGRGRGRGTAARVQNHGRPVTQSVESQPQLQPQPPEGAPTGPRKGNSNVPANREHTGGARKPKLSEEELAERMVSIKLKNESLTAAHARAEADRASFAEREEKAKKEAALARRDADKRAKEERKDRQQMMGERERNRLRKLKAMEGREWDSDKQEQDFSRGGKFDGKDFAGDQPDYTDGREYLYREPKGLRGGSRGGRGGRSDKPTEQAVPKSEDFPALAPTGSTNAKVAATTEDEQIPLDLKATATASSDNKSWAEQVESAG